uniref:Claudin n=1 Tax=Scophthalmus maximus TaxID=52904 RepID=A0A8D3D8S1_SCOMX
MASSGMQLLGFFLSLLGVSATVAATFMVEWKRQAQGKTHRIYEGLWMSCSGNERTTCELYESLLKLPTEVQATRAVMLLSVFLSAVALMVSTVGMKCTRFMDDKSESKSTTAMIGGIMFMVSGVFSAAAGPDFYSWDHLVTSLISWTSIHPSSTLKGCGGAGANPS